MLTTFHNVRIDIEAETPEKAYERLCEILAVGTVTNELEYTTDTFTTIDAPDTYRDTCELWPDHEEEN